ncbi:MAG: hypothetical protein K0Q46_5186, partial [Rhodococcus erythropolis]|nr:hypothetical protein [Rhodococcus erythropolis]
WSGTPSKVPNVWSWTYTDAQGEEHDLQVTYDEQGRPHRVFDNYTSTLYLYDWSTGEPVLIGDPHYLDPGVAFDQPYTGEIMSFVLPPLRGGRLIAGAVRAEDLIVSNRTTPTRPPTSAPSVPAQSVPRPGGVPPRGIPVIDGTVAPAEHDQPSVPSVNEPARPDPTIPEPSQPTFPGDPDRGEREPSTPGEIGDPGPNLTPGISTPNVPSPGHVEEPSVPTLPDVGQVPVNPDAPGAPQQPGPPEFDPFATDPSTIPSPGAIEDPTERPSTSVVTPPQNEHEPIQPGATFVGPPGSEGDRTPGTSPTVEQPLDSTWPLGTDFPSGDTSDSPGPTEHVDMPDFPWPPANTWGQVYPAILDPRTFETIRPFPYGMPSVPPADRVTWSSSARQIFLAEWEERGFPVPEPAAPGADPWAGWEVHHILPRKYGGTNDFWNLVPLPNSIHALFTRWWEFYADIYN